MTSGPRTRPDHPWQQRCQSMKARRRADHFRRLATRKALEDRLRKAHQRFKEGKA